MKFQTVILSSLLIATSSAGFFPEKLDAMKSVISRIKGPTKPNLGNTGRKPSYQSPAFNPKGGLSRKPGAASTPPTARTQVIKKRGFLKTVWNVGKGILGL